VLCMLCNFVILWLILVMWFVVSVLIWVLWCFELCYSVSRLVILLIEKLSLCVCWMKCRV